MALRKGGLSSSDASVTSYAPAAMLSAHDLCGCARVPLQTAPRASKAAPVLRHPKRSLTRMTIAFVAMSGTAEEGMNYTG